MDPQFVRVCLWDSASLYFDFLCVSCANTTRYLDFTYLKSALTFCQLELCRTMLSDITIPVIVACFALV